MSVRHPHILQRSKAALIIIDMQEKFMPVINNYPDIEEKVCLLTQGFNILQGPVYYTEQYPRGLGHTADKIATYLGAIEPIEKMRFSAATDKLLEQLRENSIEQVVLTGIETHVCVIQSALDFVKIGFQVHVAADATGSRTEENRLVALERMRLHGIDVTTVESCLFEMLEEAGTQEFKEISRLLK